MKDPGDVVEEGGPSDAQMSELRSALDSQCQQFRCSIEDAFLMHQRSQEDLVARWLTRLRASGSAALGSAADSGGALEAQQRRGTPQGRDEAEEVSHGAPGPARSAEQDEAWLVGTVAGARCVELATEEANPMPPLPLSPLESSLERIEQQLREQSAALRGLNLHSGAGRGSTRRSTSKDRSEFSGEAPQGSRKSQRSEAERSEFGAASIASTQLLQRGASALDISEFNDDETVRTPDLEKLEGRPWWVKFIPKRVMDFVEWAQDLDEPKRTGLLASITRHWMFELASGTVIFADSAVTVYSVDYQVTNLVPVESQVLAIFGRAFLVYYWIELLMKLFVHRLYFFVNETAAWNILDLSLVIAAAVDDIMSAVHGGGGEDVMFMRSMRIFRMAKILRGLRLMRFFSELRLLLNSLVGSLLSLFWSLLMMAMIFYLFGLMFVLGSVEFLSNGAGDEEQQRDVRRAFGGVSTAMLSLFKASMGGDDWGVFYDIALSIGSFEAFVFLLFIAFTAVAVMNILTGVFVENAMKHAKPDREMLALEHQKQKMADSTQLRRLFRELTGGENKLLTSRILVTALRRKANVRAQLSILGLEIRDGMTLYKLLASACVGEGVDVEAFVDGCLRLKGSPSSIDVQCILLHAQKLERGLHELRNDMETRFGTIDDPAAGEKDIETFREDCARAASEVKSAMPVSQVSPAMIRHAQL